MAHKSNNVNFARPIGEPQWDKQHVETDLWVAV